VLNRSREQITKVVEGLGAVHEVGDVLGLVGVHARRDVNQHQGANEVGSFVSKQNRAHAAEGHAHQRQRDVRQLLERAREVARVARDGRRGVRRRVGVSVPGQVKRQQRSLQDQRGRVKGVGVLCAAVHERDLGSLSPQRSPLSWRSPSTATKKRRTVGIGTTRPHSLRFS